MTRIRVLGLVMLAGCALEDGRGFARLSGSLRAHLPGLAQGSARLSSDGWFKTNNSFELELTSLQLELRQVSLQATESSAAATEDCSFDPANPPPGCDLCHGNHCHCPGSLKSYEELEAEVCGTGGAGGPSTVAALTIEQSFSLMEQGTSKELDTCSPSCELGQGEVDRVGVVMERLSLAGRLRDLSIEDRLQGQELSVSVDWNLSGASLGDALASPEVLGRDAPYYFELHIEVVTADTLFDTIDWHQLARKQESISIDVTDNAAAGEILTANLAQSEITTRIIRTDD